MSQGCPSCGAAVEHDFGVTTCAKCGVVLFVDFDGQIQVSTPETQAESAEPVMEAAAIEPVVDPVMEPVFNPIPETAIEVPSVELYQQEPHQPELYPEDPPQVEAEMDDSAEVAVEPNSEYSFEPVEPAAMPMPDNQVLDFSDVVEYANRAELDNNSLVYNLRIEGIDHKDIRKKVEMALSDPKLNFHTQDIFPLIRGGVLELSGLSPVKTSVIANRLREESVQFKWTQHIYDSTADTAEVMSEDFESGNIQNDVG